MSGSAVLITTDVAYKVTDLLLAKGFKVTEDKWYRLIYTSDKYNLKFIKEKIPKGMKYIHHITKINLDTGEETLYTKKIETRQLIKELMLLADAEV